MRRLSSIVVFNHCLTLSLLSSLLMVRRVSMTMRRVLITVRKVLMTVRKVFMMVRKTINE